MPTNYESTQKLKQIVINSFHSMVDQAYQEGYTTEQIADMICEVLLHPDQPRYSWTEDGYQARRAAQEYSKGVLDEQT
jgi:hypothetical protein